MTDKIEYGWQPIETAPKDGTGFFYYQNLPHGQRWYGSAIYHNGQQQRLLVPCHSL